MTRRTFLAATSVPLLRPPSHPSAPTTLFRQAMHAYQRGTPLALVQAHTLLTDLLAQDPRHARATAMLAAVYRQYYTLGLTEHAAVTTEESLRLGRLAHTLAVQEAPPQSSLPWVLEQRGWQALYLEYNHAAAMQAAQEALAHTPRFFPAYALQAHTAAYQGHPRLSFRLTNMERRLNPSPSGMSHFHEGHAYVVWATQSQDDPTHAHALWDMAQRAFHTALKTAPQHLPTRAYLAAALFALNHGAAARAIMPAFPSSVRDKLPYVQHETLAQLCDIWDQFHVEPDPEEASV
jgi:tetratricopeptide (TPR) repeat protein